MTRFSRRFPTCSPVGIPSPHDNGVGSGNYSQPARTVVFGHELFLSDVETFRAACEGVNQEPVVWVVGDTAKMPVFGAPPPGEGYTKITAQGAKDIVEMEKE